MPYNTGNYENERRKL